MVVSEQLARDLMPLVNFPDNFDLITEYANFRIQDCYKELETTYAPDAMYRLQGQIKELRVLLSLQDHVRASVK